MTAGLARSVQARLVQHAHELGLDPNLVLSRYGMERLLYRLSRSPYAERFVLKGGLLLLAWLGETLRPTRDADLLGLEALDAEALRRIFAEVCTRPVGPDALEFDPASVLVEPIRVEDAYGGQRVLIRGLLGSARIRAQVDVGAGDSVVPAPEWLEYPSLLDLPRPRLLAYRPETAIAEKLHAMVELDARNSRMRDFFDVHALAERTGFEGAVLTAAIAATFSKRRTAVPRELPLALTPAFAAVEGKAAQWRGFVRRLPGTSTTPEMAELLEMVAAFAGPVLLAVGRGGPFDRVWPPGGPWQVRRSEGQ